MVKNKDFKILSEIHKVSLEETKIIEFLPGVSIGPKFGELRRYEVISLIGVGCSGGVYLVKDYEENQGLFALKVILPQVLKTQETVNVFIELINELYEFDHPSVLNVLDLWQQKKLYFYITEYIEGDSLREWIKDIKVKGKYVSVIEACDIFNSICDSVEYLHRTGGHGLLHSNNVLLYENGERKNIKVTDFGIQSLFSEKVKSDLSRSPYYENYLAPEIQSKNANIQLCDIYSLGVLLYEILTYEYPSGGDSRVSSIRYDIPPGLDDIICKAFHLDPKCRYQSIRELKTELGFFQKDIGNRKARTLRISETKDVSTKRLKIREATDVLSTLVEKYKSTELEKKSTENESNSESENFQIINTQLKRIQEKQSANTSTEENFQIHETEKYYKKKNEAVEKSQEAKDYSLSQKMQKHGNVMDYLEKESRGEKEQNLSDIGPLSAIPLDSADDNIVDEDSLVTSEELSPKSTISLKAPDELNLKKSGESESRAKPKLSRYFTGSAEEEAQEKNISEQDDSQAKMNNEDIQAFIESEKNKVETTDNLLENTKSLPPSVRKTKLTKYFPAALNEKKDDLGKKEGYLEDKDVKERIIEVSFESSTDASEKLDIAEKITSNDAEVGQKTGKITSDGTEVGQKTNSDLKSADVEIQFKDELDELDEKTELKSGSDLSMPLDDNAGIENDSEKKVPDTKLAKDTGVKKAEPNIVVQFEENSDLSDEQNIVSSTMEVQCEDAPDDLADEKKAENSSETVLSEKVENKEEERANSVPEQNIQESQKNVVEDEEESEEEKELRLNVENHQRKVEAILQEGDDFATEGEFEEAIMKWQQIVDFIDPVEIEDRIMQIVDMSVEVAQEKLDEDNCWEAQRIIEIVMPYTTDDFVENLYDEIIAEVKNKEKSFQDALEQVNNHLQKKQYQAAIEVLNNIKGLTPDTEILSTKIRDIMKIQKQVNADESEYMQLIFTAKLLEEKNSYYEALQTFEKIRQKQSIWLCPISDIGSDIERVSKLVASMEVSEKANQILTQIEGLLSQGNWREAKKYLEDPVFQRKLVPKVEKRTIEKRNKVKDFEKRYKKKKRKIYLMCSVLLIIGIVAAAYVFFK